MVPRSGNQETGEAMFLCRTSMRSPDPDRGRMNMHRDLKARRAFVFAMTLLMSLAFISMVMPTSQAAEVTVFPMNDGTAELRGDSNIEMS